MRRNYLKLKQLMDSQNISMGILSKKTKISISSLSRKFNQIHRFTEEDIFKICKFLKICPCEYFFGSDLQKMHNIGQKITENEQEGEIA